MNTKEIARFIEQTVVGMDVQGMQKADMVLKKEKIIICKAVKDWVKPYSDMDNYLPVVMFSTHPRFTAGTRLDWGFFGIVLDEGYSVYVLGTGVSNNKWVDGHLPK